jgi:hypothetical protein
MWMQVLVVGGLLPGGALGKAVQEADSLCRRYGISVAIAFAERPDRAPKAFGCYG